MPARHAKPSNLRLAPVVLLTASGGGLGGLALMSTPVVHLASASPAGASTLVRPAAPARGTAPVASRSQARPALARTTVAPVVAPSKAASRAVTAPPAMAAPLAGDAWVAPVKAVITSPFGYRWGQLHKGLDFGASYGTAIHAAADGVVVAAGQPESGYGNMVLIQHADGVVTAYAHQSRIVATVGEHVTAGEVIGYVGSTGHSTGPHLHFEVRIGGTKAINPRPWLAAHGVFV